MACDTIVFAPHPDDAELHCGATIAGLTRRGARVVVIDCTRGELASRGSVATRAEEAAAASAALGLAGRHNLGLPDGALDRQPAALCTALAGCLRRHRPRLVLGMAVAARHPDHLALARALAPACKAAALHRHPSAAAGPAQTISRLLTYEAELPLAATLLLRAEEVDRERKRTAIACYASQFTVDPALPTTSISQPGFLDWIDARGRVWGQHAGSVYAEAFCSPDSPLALADPLTDC